MPYLKASEEGKELIRKARNEKGWKVEDPRWLIETSKIVDPTWNENPEFFADGVSAGAWKAFLYNRRTKGIDTNVFKAFCKVLDLNWRNVIKTDQEDSRSDLIFTSIAKNSVAESNDIKQFQESVVKIKQYCQRKYKIEYSKVRLLSGVYVDLDELFIPAYTVDRPENFFHSTSREKFKKSRERSRHKLIDTEDGYQKIQDYLLERERLEIIGKPGSGKSTFIKYLCLSWCKEKVFQDKIVIFFESKEVKFKKTKYFYSSIAKKIGLSNSNFLEFWEIYKAIKDKQSRVNQMREEGMSTTENGEEETTEERYKEEEIYDDENDAENEIYRLKEKCKQTILGHLLTKAALIIMIDGLDEIPRQDYRERLDRCIREITESHNKTKFILTYRTQLLKSTYSPLEIIGFDDNSVNHFFSKWSQFNNISEEQQSEYCKY